MDALCGIAHLLGVGDRPVREDLRLRALLLFHVILIHLPKELK